MITSNPIAELSAFTPPLAMQLYVIAMAVLVVGGTILDTLHKNSAKYFFENAKKAQANAQRPLSSGEKVSIAFKTLTEDVLASGEICNLKRRIAHLLTMYGFLLFVVTTVILVFGYPTPETLAPALLALLWHLGALMVCIGGYWFWFAIRVDVAAEGYPWYRVVRADLFIMSLLATTTLALIWSFLQWAGAGALATLFFSLFVLASTVLFSGVM